MLDSELRCIPFIESMLELRRVAALDGSRNDGEFLREIFMGSRWLGELIGSRCVGDPLMGSSLGLVLSLLPSRLLIARLCLSCISATASITILAAFSFLFLIKDESSFNMNSSELSVTLVTGAVLTTFCL